ncbi:2480_t:CDS:1, partial [Ambispora leptoticha]
MDGNERFVLTLDNEIEEMFECFVKEEDPEGFDFNEGDEATFESLVESTDLVVEEDLPEVTDFFDFKEGLKFSLTLPVTFEFEVFEVDIVRDFEVVELFVTDFVLDFEETFSLEVDELRLFDKVTFDLHFFKGGEEVLGDTVDGRFDITLVSFFECDTILFGEGGGVTKDGLQFFFGDFFDKEEGEDRLFLEILLLFVEAELFSDDKEESLE